MNLHKTHQETQNGQKVRLRLRYILKVVQNRCVTVITFLIMISDTGDNNKITQMCPNL